MNSPFMTPSLSRCLLGTPLWREDMPSQRSPQNEPIFRLLLKVAVRGAHQCEFPIFAGLWPNYFVAERSLPRSVEKRARPADESGLILVVFFAQIFVPCHALWHHLCQETLSGSRQLPPSNKLTWLALYADHEAHTRRIEHCTALCSL